MKSYYRLILGRKHVHAPECFTGGFVGTDFDIRQDLSRQLPDESRDFNKEFIPVWLDLNPDKSKVSAALSCGALWTVSKGAQKGDLVLCPDGAGTYRIGEFLGEYYYAEGETLPHRRKVQWLDATIERAAMSETLRNSTGSIGTVCNISNYREEIEGLLGADAIPHPTLSVSGDSEIEDPIAFALEKHLEDFLVTNWGQTVLSSEFSIYEEDGESIGQQYQTDAGIIDILAVSKDRKRLLVIELKRGRASDVVVGQVLRYMGYLKDQIAEDDQTVEGVIIALEDDRKLRWALMSVPSISFYRYEVSFNLVKI
jgi:restriction system protein